MSLAKEAAEMQENIDFNSFWHSEGRGRGPVVTWNAQQQQPFHRAGDQKLESALEYARAQGHGEAVLSKIRDEHDRTLAIQAIGAAARVS